MSFTGYAFDIYPYNDPNGTRLVRLTPSKAVTLAFRLPEVGFGMADGQIIIHSSHTDATAANFHKHNLVKVVDIATETKVGGFFLEEGDFAALSTAEEGGRLLTFRGPNTVYYLERALLREEPFSEVAEAGTVRGSFDVDGMWTWTNIYAGQIMVRAMEEGFYQPGPSGTSSDAPLADATWDFDRVNDSESNAWSTAPSGAFDYPWGTSILDLLISLQRVGLHWRSGPDLDFHAYNTDPAVDRTSTSFAADKVLFKAGENIVTEVSRQIQASVERTALLVTGSENETAYVTGGSSDVTWIGHVDATITGDSTVLTGVGNTNLDSREVQTDQAFPLKHIVADDELNGGYIPFIHYVPGDLVTIHTGTGDHDFNNFAIPVAAVRILHDSAGNWFGMPELGAQSLSTESKAFEDRVNRIIHQPGGHSHPPNPELCRIPTPSSVSSPTYDSSSGNAGDQPTEQWVAAIPSGLSDSYMLVFSAHQSAQHPVTDVDWYQYDDDSAPDTPDAFGSIVADASGGSWRASAFGLDSPGASENPLTGSHEPSYLQVFYSADGWSIQQALVYTGVTSQPASAAAQGTSTAPSVTVATQDGDVVVGMVFCPSTTATITDGADQTRRRTNTGGFVKRQMATSDKSATGTSTTLSWALSSSLEWSAIAVVLRGSGSGGTSGSAGDLPQPVGANDEAAVGTSIRATRCDHVHPHSDLSDHSDEIHHAARSIEIADAGGYYTGTEVEAALQETGPRLVPAGGTTGQVLAKQSATDYDTEWTDQTGGGGSGSGSYAETIGDGVATSFQVTHSLGSEDVIVQLYDLTGTDPVEATADATSITVDDTDNVTVVFGSAPATNAYRVVVVSAGGGEFTEQATVERTAGDLTTGSTSFVDATGLTVTLTTAAVRCMVFVSLTMGNATTTANTSLDIAIDGVRVGQGLGLVVRTGTAVPVGIAYLTSVLSAGSHTIKLQWKASAGTSTLYASAGVTPARLTVVETSMTT